METPETTAREEVQAFVRACEALAEFAQDHDGLTDLERRIVRTFVRTLEHEVAPSPPPLEARYSWTNEITMGEEKRD